jgi:hypothetical protein
VTSLIRKCTGKAKWNGKGAMSMKENGNWVRGKAKASLPGVMGKCRKERLERIS